MISCKCLTAGRVHLIEEALFSFLNLTYKGKKELIIVNDYPYQTLEFNHPEVKIVNKTELFPTIGDKDIFAHDLCQGDIIQVADDDDIALPHHLDNVEKYLQDNDILHWANGGYYNEYPKLTIQFGGLGNSGIVYTRDAYIQVGKSPKVNAGGDSILVNKLHNLRNKVANAAPPNEEISWLYRWATPASDTGVGCYHQSGMGTDTPDREDIRIRNFKYLEGLRKQGKLPTGTIKLQPKWKHNYIELVKQFLP